MTPTTDVPDAGGTAAALTTDRVPRLAPDDTISQVRTRLLGNRYDSLRDLPVCRADGTVVGALRIEELFAAMPGALVGELMDTDPPTLTRDADEEVAAWHSVRHGQSSLIVVDDDGRLAGVVPPHRLLAVLLREHDVDVARLGGFLASVRPAEAAGREPVRRRLGHRLPWLLVGLAGALAAAGLMAGFETRLRENLTLALFLPGVVYLADAVGTQTEALVIRGLSIGVKIREILWRELVTGLLAGVTLGLLFLPIGLLLWDEPRVVTAVALAFAAACSIANAVAMALPALLHRLSIDPAFGSGPLATVVQDLFSITIYLAIASLLVA